MSATAVARGGLLLDREVELGVTGRCLDSACAGNGSVLLVEGPGGIGKTELLLAARREATARGMVVAGARGAELESEIAFGVVRQLLEPIVSREQGRPLFEGAASLARSVFEADVVGGPSAGWAERSFAVLHGLYWLCATLAERAPLQLVVDDAHWADPASLEFLVYLGRRVSDLPVALVVASRPAEEAEERERLLVDLRADPATATLYPRPLGTGAVGKLVEVATGRTPGETFVSACRAATDGNPFLMRELVRELRDRAIDPSDEAAEQVRELGPRSVARRLLSRLRSLPPVAVPVARAAAVLGRDGQARDIAALVGITPDEATAALDALAVAGIVTAERPVQFVHPIVRSAIYADIPAGERAALHGRATEALQDAGAPLERVVSHLMATEPAGRAAIVDRLREVAAQALARGAPSSAVSYLRRALAEPPPAGLRPSVLTELGEAESLVGDERAIGHLREALERSGEDAIRRAAGVALGRFLVLTGQPGRAAAIYEAAPPSSDRLGVAFEAAAVAASSGDVQAAQRMADRVARLREYARAHPDAPATVFAALAIVGAHANEPAERVSELALRALVPPAAGARGLGWVTNLIATFSALLFVERYDAAARVVEEALETVRVRGSAVHFAMCSAMRGWLALRVGAVADAEAEARAALEGAPRQAHGFYGLVALATLVESLVERAQLEEAERELARIGLPERPTAVTYAAVLHSRGRLRLAQGDAALALEDFLGAGTHLSRARCTTPSPAAWRSGAAAAHLALGDAGRARELAAEEVALARELGAPRALGVALRAAGLAEEGGRGMALLQQAVDALVLSQSTLELARASTDLGATLRRRGKRAEARRHLRRALDLAQRCRGEAVAEHARAELLATGARPRKVLLSGPESLTASERRVAGMAARGMTNREIAQALFVTQRTVETHLTHVFQKLGIESRTALVAALEATAG